MQNYEIKRIAALIDLMAEILDCHTNAILENLPVLKPQDVEGIQRVIGELNEF